MPMTHHENCCPIWWTQSTLASRSTDIPTINFRLSRVVRLPTPLWNTCMVLKNSGPTRGFGPWCEANILGQFQTCQEQFKMLAACHPQSPPNHQPIIFLFPLHEYLVCKSYQISPHHSIYHATNLQSCESKKMKEKSETKDDSHQILFYQRKVIISAPWLH